MRSVSPDLSVDGARSMWTPRARMMLTVDVQSAPGEKLVTTASPLARLLNMTARCEIDLSPGALITPRSVGGWLTVIAMWRPLRNLVNPVIAGIQQGMVGRLHPHPNPLPEGEGVLRRCPSRERELRRGYFQGRRSLPGISYG